jgi:RNase H-fold protein (predicted Holliday junction resolvase)
MTILGISIGTRTSGIAIMSDRGLLSWNTLSFKSAWNEKKGEAIVKKYQKYLHHHQVTAVVLKVPRVSHHTDAILTLLKRIDQIIKSHGCMVTYKTQSDIKVAVPHIKNGKDLIEHTTSLYPVLHRAQSRELTNRNNYHDKMFEAVLVAHLWKDEYRNSPQ